jgi:hypothetical protein
MALAFVTVVSSYLCVFLSCRNTHDLISSESLPVCMATGTKNTYIIYVPTLLGRLFYNLSHSAILEGLS